MKNTKILRPRPERQNQDHSLQDQECKTSHEIFCSTWMQWRSQRGPGSPVTIKLFQGILKHSL